MPNLQSTSSCTSMEIHGQISGPIWQVCCCHGMALDTCKRSPGCCDPSEVKATGANLSQGQASTAIDGTKKQEVAVCPVTGHLMDESDLRSSAIELSSDWKAHRLANVLQLPSFKAPLQPLAWHAADTLPAVLTVVRHLIIEEVSEGKCFGHIQTAYLVAGVVDPHGSRYDMVLWCTEL